MTEKKSSFFDNDSRWFRTTSIATYIIIAAALISMFFTGMLAYNIMFPEKVTGNTTIKGWVSDDSTEEPIEGVMVALLDTNDVAYTDEDGDYRINDTEAGVRTLVFSKVGYRTREVKYFLEETHKDTPIDLKEIGLEVMPDSIEPNTPEPGSVSGTVFSQITNEPVQGAGVRINGSSLDFDDDRKKQIHDAFQPVYTGADGKFSIDGLEVGTLELVVVVEFDENFSQENNNIKFYQEIVTFYGKDGEETVIDVTINTSNWAGLDQDLFHPFTFVNRRNVISQHDLALTFKTPVQVTDKDLNITIYQHYTGELVDTLTTGSRDNVTFTLDQGLYDIRVLCEDCRVTKVLNVSVNADTDKGIIVPYGNEPDFDDKTDTSGLLICLLPSLILIVVACLGAYYAFTQKKFFLAVLGAIAVIPMQSLMLAIPALSCISVNMILGIIAAVLIFRAKGQFLDSMAAQQEMAGPAIEPKYEEIEEAKAPAGKGEKPRKKKGKGKKGNI